jgi:hypothetical protein
LIRHFVVADKESSCSEMPQYAANPYVRIPAPVLSLLPTTTTPGCEADGTSAEQSSSSAANRTENSRTDVLSLAVASGNSRTDALSLAQDGNSAIGSGKDSTNV